MPACYLNQLCSELLPRNGNIAVNTVHFTIKGCVFDEFFYTSECCCCVKCYSFLILRGPGHGIPSSSGSPVPFEAFKGRCTSRPST